MRIRRLAVYGIALLYIATHGRGFWSRQVEPRSNPSSCSAGS